MAQDKTTLNDLAKTVAVRTNTDVNTSQEILTAAFDELAKLLAAEGALTVPNFGIFETSMRGAKKGRNLQTGELIDVAPVRGIRFRAATRLRTMIREGDTTGTIVRRKRS
jgi:DNA-binding protein HU-beta